MRVAIYPGSFDPPTNGHLDLIRRASLLYDQVIVAVGKNSLKATMFTAEERCSMLSDLCNGLSNVSVESFENLLVEFAAQKGAGVILRGMRAISDFEKEFQMALTNRTLAPKLETVFLPTSADLMFVSSSIVKEVSRLGGDVDKLVPSLVAQRLKERLAGG